MIIYYTDGHDVDEELMTITAYGGAWGDTLSGVGITIRTMDNAPTEAWDIVASSNIQNIELYGWS